ncbi:hypothetical protein PG985_016375 [Apiospora marii]|uniref:Uncharacterized protein n=1 Tax=Apiospora marii TaxID=335849 RepID=A0ABR1R482_9PEZI
MDCPPPSKDEWSFGTWSGPSNPNSTTPPTTEPASSPADTNTKSSSSPCTPKVATTNSRIMCSTACSNQRASASTIVYSTSRSPVLPICRRCGIISTRVKFGECSPFIPRPGSSLDRARMLSYRVTGCGSKGVDFSELARIYLEPDPDWDDGTGDGDESDDHLSPTDI